MTSFRIAFGAAFAGTVMLASLGAAALPAAAHASTLAASIPSDPTDPPGTFHEENLVPDQTNQNFFYRIPALAYLGDNVVVAAIDGRPDNWNDAPNPNSIVMRRSTDGGVTWGEQTVIAAGHKSTGPGDQQFGYSDPSFVYDAEANKLFMFSVYSKNQGFGGSSYGNDDADPNVISASVIESSDGGLTWSAPRYLTKEIKTFNGTKEQPAIGDVKGFFASSGEGIQLKYGEHAGRLIQQYAGIVNAASGETIQAWSVYSDDHGVTWHKGENVGWGMDENKTVELSDGTLMMNSRDSSRSTGGRWVAYSTDGGVTYSEPKPDTTLVDPVNNASITRLFPNAAQGSADAKKLLFTNTAVPVGSPRADVTARVSCDDGKTWPVARLIHAGQSQYSTATRLNDGFIGVYYEVTAVNDSRFARFDDAWLNVLCAPLTAQSPTVKAGGTATVAVTITNQEATALRGATIAATVPAGWSSQPAAVPDLAPGASATLNVPITVPAGTAGGATPVTFVATSAAGTQSMVAASALVLAADSVNIDGVWVAGVAEQRDVEATPYAEGDQVKYTFSVTSTNAEEVSVEPTAGNFAANFVPPAAGNCRYRSLGAGKGYVCSTTHTVTAEDLARGFFEPRSTWKVTRGTASTTLEVRGAQVPLKAADSGSGGGTVEPVYKTATSDVLYRLTGTGAETRPVALTFAEWAEMGYPAPRAFRSAYVKYPWADAIYAVTFWNAAPASWTWQQLTWQEWLDASAPTPYAPGWIEGTTLFKYPTSDEIFAQLGDKVHKLTWNEWSAMGFRPFENRANGGYVKTAANDTIYKLTGSAGSPITFAQWIAAGLPTPRVVATTPPAPPA
ncbi:exo-alpha-sialidase [Micrococcales bacterium 31B]|nr:exo-alpha-sialidase [Micrococcales bacterium 31B]